MRKEIYAIFFLFIFYQQVSAEKIDSSKCVNGAFNAAKTINQILLVLNDSAAISGYYTIDILDSICFSKKSVYDYSREKNIYTKELDLGNDLLYRYHYISNLDISYVAYFNRYLVKIRFKYPFYYGGKVQVDDSIINKLKSICNLPLEFRTGQYDITYFETELILPWSLEKYKQEYPKVNFDIPPNVISQKLQSKIKFVNDPTNQLTYGFACSIGGEAPEGFDVFARLVHFKHFDIIEKLLYSPNPVTRLNACDALEYGSDKDIYALTSKISNRINKIKQEETKIECCWGCEFEIIPIKDAVIKAEEAKKYLYSNFFFMKDEE